MPYVGYDFPAADFGSTVTYFFDFTFALATGEAITSASWTCTTASDSQLYDPYAPNRISGPPSITGNIVGQRFTGYVAGVKYLVEVSATTSIGNTLTCWSHFYCDSPNAIVTGSLPSAIGVAAVSGSLATDSLDGVQTVNASTALVTSGLVTVTLAAGSTVTLPGSPTIGQHCWIRAGVPITGAVISATSNVIPLNSTTAGNVIIGTGGSFAHLVFDGFNWHVLEGA